MVSRMGVTRRRLHRARRTRDQRGVTLILLALSATAIMIVAALFLDVGNSYSVRRSMQNAADAGAMAGAQALYKAVVAGSIASGTTDVYGQAKSIAINADGASLPTDGEDFCDFVDSSGNSKGVCTSSGAVPSGVVGVRVNVQNSRRSFFGSIIGQSTLNVTARAAASIQQVGGTGAPWIICGTSGAANGGWNFLTSSPSDTEDSSDTGPDTDDTLNSYSSLLPLLGWKGSDTTNPPSDKKSDPNAPMLIQGPSGNAKCGSKSSSADGKGSGTSLSNGMQSVSTGNGSNNITNSNTSVPVGTCYSTVKCVPCPTGTYQPEKNATVIAGCDILLPISDWASGTGSTASYHVVTEAVFHIEAGSGSDKIIGWLDDPTNNNFVLTPSLSQTGNCTPGSQLCVVKLVDFPTNGLLE